MAKVAKSTRYNLHLHRPQVIWTFLEHDVINWPFNVSWILMCMGTRTNGKWDCLSMTFLCTVFP